MVPDAAELKREAPVSGLPDLPHSWEGIVAGFPDRSNWSITLFTSGTTGIPKRVKHTFRSLTRAVQTGDHHRSSVWGFAYNPTHIAGLQVLFQALVNGNPLVDIFMSERQVILDAIERYGITHISATPTYFRLLLPVEQSFSGVQRITSGGERFDPKLMTAVGDMFPNARVRNVYASTEAGTILAGTGEIFSADEAQRDFLRIVENELWIHRDLLGESPGLQLDAEWYHTGDMVEILQESPLTFRFLSRRNEMINVGGYKVNPHEVEDQLRELEGIVDARVYGQTNSVVGNLLCCDIVTEQEGFPDDRTIRSALRERLQPFKVPRMIHRKAQLDHTRTGKLKRQ